jgi:hypothetical protein
MLNASSNQNLCKGVSGGVVRDRCASFDRSNMVALKGAVRFRSRRATFDDVKSMDRLYLRTPLPHAALRFDGSAMHPSR